MVYFLCPKGKKNPTSLANLEPITPDLGSELQCNRFVYTILYPVVRSSKERVTVQKEEEGAGMLINVTYRFIIRTCNL